MDHKKFLSQISKKGWAKVSKEERTKIMKKRGANGNKKRWANKTPEQRKAFSEMLNKKKKEKLLIK